MRWACVSMVLVACSILISATPPMAQAQANPDLLTQRAVLELPGMASVQVDTGLVFREIGGQILKLDFFHPVAGESHAREPRDARPSSSS